MGKNNTGLPDPRMVFWKRGACSTAMCHLLNRTYNNNEPVEEEAICLLAGGIAMKGYQCGMIWGASLAAGIEAYRRYSCCDTAVEAAVNASRHLTESFMKRTRTVNCRGNSFIF